MQDTNQAITEPESPTNFSGLSVRMRSIVLNEIVSKYNNTANEIVTVFLYSLLSTVSSWTNFFKKFCYETEYERSADTYTSQDATPKFILHFGSIFVTDSTHSSKIVKYYRTGASDPAVKITWYIHPPPGTLIFPCIILMSQKSIWCFGT